jgi:hypothetical protein
MRTIMRQQKGDCTKLALYNGAFKRRKGWLDNAAVQDYCLKP